MEINKEEYEAIVKKLKFRNIRLVAVGKTKTVGAIKELYELGQRDFGENYVQELLDKQAKLPADIQWHFIGHLQTNKVKYISPFVHLIHGVDSSKLLKEINKQGEKNDRVINVLLQIHIAQEETKFGFNEEEFNSMISELENLKMKHVLINGLMGMASFTQNKEQVRKEFRSLKVLFDKYSQLSIGNYQPSTLSMGMSADYEIAIEEGSNMVRIGSLIFGNRP